ncbi:MAG: amidohydrolase family protein [Cellulomonas sp.]|nr:amidohydrolase family protein [Cellulomonas sp.]
MTAPLVLRRARRLGSPVPVDLLLADGRVSAVGQVTSRDVEQVDLDGRWVLPGLWDQHVHVTQWALARDRLDLADARSAAHAVTLVAERLAHRPPAPGTALVGRGFRDALWPDVPSAALLDAVVGDVPVVLVAADLHCAWASTAGLALLGANGHPTGVLREQEWMGVMGALDQVSDAVADAAVAEALTAAAARGVVGLVDVEIADNVAVWRRRPVPAVQVRAGVWEPYLDRVLHDDLATGDRLAPRVTQGPLKVIVDGSLNTRTAWCRDPYLGTDGHGVLSVPPDHLRVLLSSAARHGLTVMVHAIGDAALDVALDAIEAAGARGSVEHVQLLAPGQASRLARLGLVAGVQPRHVVDDRDVTDRVWADRADRAYLYRTLHEAGVPLAFGSDAPVAVLDPWLAMDAAVWRTSDEREPWFGEQRLDVLTALAASVDGASLDVPVGARADLVVLDDDPLAAAAAPGGLSAVRVAGTLVGGEWTSPLG